MSGMLAEKGALLAPMIEATGNSTNYMASYMSKVTGSTSGIYSYLKQTLLTCFMPDVNTWALPATALRGNVFNMPTVNVPSVPNA